MNGRTKFPEGLAPLPKAERPMFSANAWPSVKNRQLGCRLFATVPANQHYGDVFASEDLALLI
jgi:hypothetical protein